MVAESPFGGTGALNRLSFRYCNAFIRRARCGLKKRHFVMRITDIRYAGCSFPSDLEGVSP